MQNMFKIFLILILSASILPAQTERSGTIDGQVWSRNQSPFHIVGDITVLDLVIEAGVEIFFLNDYAFEVEGSLVAIGAEQDSIYFRRHPSNNSGWKGISINSTAADLLLKHVVVTGSSESAITVEEGMVTIKEGDIRQNTKHGINLLGGSAQLTRVNVRNNLLNGARIGSAAVLYGYASTFQDNSGSGLRIEGGSAYLSSSIIAGNAERGIYFSSSGQTLSLINVTVCHNVSEGLLSLAGTVEIKNSIFYFNGAQLPIVRLGGNLSVTYSNVEDPAYQGIDGNINADPQFSGGTLFRLMEQSACVDAGNPDPQYNDQYFPPSLGGIRNDMGAYGGPLARLWYQPLFVDPLALNFGNVGYNKEKHKTVELNNYSGEVLYIDSLRIAGTNADKYHLINPPADYPWSIEIAQNYPLEVAFIPLQKSANPFKAELRIYSDQGNRVVDLSGRGVAPQIFVQTNQLDFGSRQFGDSTAQSLSIYNTGLDTLLIADLSLSNPRVFKTITPKVSIDPYPSDPLEVIVYFKPDSAFAYKDTLYILSNDPDKSSISITLTGLGIAPVIKTNQLVDFGTIPIYSDTTSFLSLQNVGNEDLVIKEAQVVGADSAQFMLKTPVELLTIPVGADPEVFELDFSPRQAGRLSAYLQLVTNDPHPLRDTLMVALNGQALAPELVVLDLLDYGNVRVQDDSLLYFPVRNSGSLDLLIDTLYLEMNTSEHFILQTTVSALLLPPESNDYPIGITFAPMSEGLKEAQLVILSNDYRRDTTRVLIKGRGVTPQMVTDLETIDFGTVHLGEDSLIVRKIWNQGSAPLRIDSIRISGNSAGHFQVNNEAFPLVIDANSGADSLLIRFNPGSFGPKEAQLQFVTDDLENPQVNIDLRGLGVAALIQAEPAVIDLGKVPVDRDTAYTVLIRNPGNGDLQIKQSRFYRDDQNEFRLHQLQPPFVIPPADSLAVEIYFRPKERAKREVSWQLISNAYQNDTLSIPIVAVGIIPGMPFLYVEMDNAYNFNDVVITGQRKYQLPIQNLSEDADLRIDSLRIVGDDAAAFAIEAEHTTFTVPPLGQYDGAGILFSPLELRNYNAQLNIYGNDTLNNPYILSLSGQGMLDQTPATVSFEPVFNQFTLNQGSTFEVILRDDESQIQGAELYIRPGGANTFEKIILVHDEEDKWLVEVPAGLITERGVEYYLKIGHGGIETIYPERGSDQPLSLTVQIPSYSFPFDTREGLYQKISIPFHSGFQTLSDLFEDDLGPYDSTKYRIFDWDQSKTSWKEYSSLTQKLPPGKALYLITREPQRLTMGNCETVPTTQDYPLTLRAGWNMIAVPFAFPVAWQEVLPNSSDEDLFVYGGNGWSLAQTLEPFTGYAYYSNQDTTLTIPAKPRNPSKPANTMASLKKGEWRIQIEARRGDKEDSYNYAGVRFGAEGQSSRFFRPEPPAIGPHISLYFFTPEENGDVTKLAADYRTPGEDIYIYYFAWESNFSAKTDLNFIAYDLPNDYDYLIVSMDGNVKLSGAEISSSLRERQFKLIVGRSEAIKELASEFKELPKELKISKNFPNPFNPVTMITIELPGEAYIDADVFDLLGRKVKTIASNELKEEGYHRLQWDGTNDLNQKVASGIYFFNFRTAQFSKVIKMVLQR